MRMRRSVLTTYGHLLPDSEDRTRRAIDDAWTSDGRGTDGGDHPQHIGPSQRLIWFACLLLTPYCSPSALDSHFSA